MHLAITLPAYNEENSIAQVIKGIPRRIDGIDKTTIIVINDGSSDRTTEKARTARADIVLENKGNLGLAKTYDKGLAAALAAGADIILNIDSDGQHDPQEIPRLIAPVRRGMADLAVGNRQIKGLKEMKRGNYYGNRLGSWIIGRLAGVDIHDASCGFRALSREAALRINIFAEHTYTHETIIQAAFKDLRIAEVPVSYRPRTDGRSRLIRGLFTHVKNSSLIIVRTVLVYKPLKVLFYFGSLVILAGLVLGLRYLILYFMFDTGPGKLQSLLLASTFIIIGFFIVMLGLVSDLIAKNRKISEQLLYHAKKNFYKKQQ